MPTICTLTHSNKKVWFCWKGHSILSCAGWYFSFFICLQQDWRIPLIPSTLVLVNKYSPAVGLKSLSFSAVITLCLYHNWLQQEQMYSGPLETLAWNFLILSLRVELYTFFSFWYWHWFVNLSCLWSADSFEIFSFWYWHWFSNLYSLHSADSFAVFSFWYWRLTVSLLYILLIHLQFLVFDTEIGLPVSFFFIHRIHLHFSFSCSFATGPTSFPLIPHFHLPFFFSHIHFL